MITTLFWVSTCLIVYAFAGYPVVLVLLRGAVRFLRKIRQAIRRPGTLPAPGEEAPFVSVVFAAYNEQAIIEEKMKNCAALDYPADRLEVLVGCDGCSDATAALARQAPLANLKVLDYTSRSGKPMVLNRTIPQARGSIVVLSDANTMLAPDAVKELARHFSDPRVGCVCGELRFTAASGRVQTEGVYWRYEVFLKSVESAMNMLVGANGGVFAIRRELFHPLPSLALIDDFLIAMYIRIAGHKVVYDPRAVAYEETAPSPKDEFKRRVRIGSGAMYALRYTWPALLPTSGLVCFSYWSHKICRWLAPVAMPVSFLSALALCRQPPYGVFAAGEVLLGLLAGAGYLLDMRRKHFFVFTVPYYFVSMNLALLVGFLRTFHRRQSTIWQRTERTQAHPAAGGPRSEGGTVE